MARFVGTKVEFGADRDVQLAIVEVTNRQIASQLLKYFSEVQALVRKPSCKRVRSPGARSRSVGREITHTGVDDIHLAVIGNLLASRKHWYSAGGDRGDQMAVQKRNDLASKCSVCVPEAISELRIAEQNIRDGKPDEALKWIAAALIHLDQLSRAFAGRAHVDLGRMCLGIGDELRNGLDRERGIDHHEKGNNADTRNGRNSADEIEVKIVVDCRIDRVRRCHEEKGVSVRSCTHDDFSANIAAGAWSIVDNKRLAEPFR